MGRKPGITVAKKTCAVCRKSKSIQEFYSNSAYKDGVGYDDWCKECIREHINSESDLQNYCYQNHRLFSADLFNTSVVEVDKALLSDPEYQKLVTEQQKGDYRFSLIRKKYIGSMNLKAFYEFDSRDNTRINIDPVLIKSKDDVVEQPFFNDTNRQFDPVWNAYLNKYEKSFLDNYYKQLNDQFDVSDIHMEDNFREVARAALEKNLAWNAMQRHEDGSDARYKTAIDLYVKLSDQAKLSTSKRTANDRIGFSDLGSLIKMIENSGALCRKQTFEKDDVDTVLEDFYWAFNSYNPIEIKRGDDDEDED